MARVPCHPARVRRREAEGRLTGWSYLRGSEEVARSLLRVVHILGHYLQDTIAFSHPPGLHARDRGAREAWPGPKPARRLATRIAGRAPAAAAAVFAEPGGAGQAVMVSVWCPAVVGIVTSVPRLVWRAW